MSAPPAWPGGICRSSNATWTHYAGFLRPSTSSGRTWTPTATASSTNSSQDNDGDRLTDLAEVTGLVFSPRRPAGQPGRHRRRRGRGRGRVPGRDRSHRHQLRAAHRQPPARGGLQRGGAVDGPQPWRSAATGCWRRTAQRRRPQLETVQTTVPGSVPPWYEAVTTYTNRGAMETRIYGVEVSR